MMKRQNRSNKHKNRNNGKKKLMQYLPPLLSNTSIILDACLNSECFSKNIHFSYE